MKFYNLYFLLCFLFLIPHLDANAVVSVQSSLSGGYFQDATKKSHEALFLSLKWNDLRPSGVETFIDLGLNNTFLQDRWQAYPYQFYLIYPLSNGLVGRPTHKSRIQIGRQFLLEDFDLKMVDGVVIPYYINDHFGAWLYGGGVHNNEERKFNFNELNYGANLFYTWNEGHFKIGPSFEKKQFLTHDKKRSLINASLLLEKEDLFLSPSILFMKQWDLDHVIYNQDLIETTLTYKILTGSLYYSKRRPDPILLDEKSYLFRIFSQTHQKTLGESLFIPISKIFSLSLKNEKINYNSRSREEQGRYFEVSLPIHLPSNLPPVNLIPTYSYLSSYGGTVHDGSMAIKYFWNDLLEFFTEGNLSKIKKINGMNFYAYHLKGGADYKLVKNWQLLAAAEWERNHLFDIDTRLIFSITHFYY